MLALTLLLGLSLTLAGCGATRPPRRTARPTTVAGSTTATTSTSTGTPAPLIQAERDHEYPSPPAPPEHARGAPTAVAAVRAFATAYINWRYTTVAADLRRLAAASVGEARAAMTLAAAQTAGDYELQRGQIANQGTVEAVTTRTGYPDQYVVVTEELTTAAATSVYQGLEPAWHVALATVARQPGGGYVVSAWQPQS